MRRLRHRAGKRLLALLAAPAAAIGGHPATAQEDPFALPKGLTAQSVAASEGPGLSEIEIDGDVRSRLVPLAYRGGALAIDAEAGRQAGLPIGDGATGMVLLSSLKVAKWSFDPLSQRLVVQLIRKSDRGNLIDLYAAPASNGDSAPLSAVRVDYDLSATYARGRANAAGLVEASLVRGNASFTTVLQLSTETAPGIASVVRLDSQLQILMPRRGMTLIAGDYISAGGQNQRALRLGGLQLGSDYSLRPDIVTTPLPSFTGQVAVPTGIDLINGDQRYSLGNVEPGEFTVRNVPASAGRGAIAVITRDALGRETIQPARFYVSRNLLPRNLSEFAVNAGFVRRRYGVRSNDYGPLAATLFYRRGISSRMTLETSAEWTPGLLNVGARGDVVLGGIAMATVELRYSRNSDLGTSGTLLNLGLESVGPRISARIGATLPSATYSDVAAKLGDQQPPRQFFAQFSFDLGNFNQLQLSATRQEHRFDPRYPLVDRRSDVVNMAFRTRLTSRMDLFANGGYRRGDRGSAISGFLGISLQLGGGRNAQASLSGSDSAPKIGYVSYARHDAEDHPLGYQFDRSFGGANRTSAAVSWRTSFTRLEGQAEFVGGELGLRANARGTLIVAGGGVFARNQTGGSYALVRTGDVGGIAIMRENRAAGVTNKHGLLLIDNIPAQVPITFDVDSEKLPADALTRNVKKHIIVPRRAVGLVALDVVRFIPRQIRVVTQDGAPVAAGTPLKALPSGEFTMVGYDGMVDWNAGGHDLQLMALTEGTPVCVVQIDPVQVRGAATGNVPTFQCRKASPEGLAELAAQPDKRGHRRRHDPASNRQIASAAPLR